LFQKPFAIPFVAASIAFKWIRNLRKQQKETTDDKNGKHFEEGTLVCFLIIPSSYLSLVQKSVVAWAGNGIEKGMNFYGNLFVLCWALENILPGSVDPSFL